MNNDRVNVQGLKIARDLYHFVVDEVLPGTGVSANQFWLGLGKAVAQFSARNRALVKERDALQAKIDAWHQEQVEKADRGDYRRFLESIGYLVPEGPDFQIDTANIDEEIALIAGPQLVVPVTNARFALNAANARWGSLYDALYGSDALGAWPHPGGGYDPERGKRVIEWARRFLDQTVPLQSGSHSDARSYVIKDGALCVTLENGSVVGLVNTRAFCGYRGQPAAPEAILLVNNGLHLEIVIDRAAEVGRSDRAGISNLVLESALTTIMDLEDSVAVVDSSDKVKAYRNWLGLCRGTLSDSFRKDGKTVKRELVQDRIYAKPDGSKLVLPGRSLMLIRNVGPLMTDASVLDRNDDEIPEEILDAVITSLIAVHDSRASNIIRNGRTGSIYIVKPKLHGPKEAAYTHDLFGHIEDMLGLSRHTIKIGLMDEERRTTVNLKECIRAVKSRIFFINTGFLDRTGDEIHTSMQAGPMICKDQMRNHAWMKAYENWNVVIGIRCGFSGRAQIGKGMWAKPDLMALMLQQKIEHVEAGATTAWVPSPIAATLHATHYHKIDARERQIHIASREPATLEDLLSIPTVSTARWSRKEIDQEINNNIQGILGYVVRWVEQGVGCSKVLDINNVALMEDRATLRISSQHIANWLLHGVVSGSEVMDAMERMAFVVDAQNVHDPAYAPMSADLESSVAFAATRDLIFGGAAEPNGYTERILYNRRRQSKKGGRCP